MNGGLSVDDVAGCAELRRASTRALQGMHWMRVSRREGSQGRYIRYSIRSAVSANFAQPTYTLRACYGTVEKYQPLPFFI